MEPGSLSWKGPKLTATNIPSHMHPSSLTHAESRKREESGRGWLCIFTFLEHWGLAPGWFCFCVSLEGGERLGGAQEEETEVDLSTTFLLKGRPGSPPNPSSPQAVLAHAGSLRAFQACTGRFGDFSLTKSAVQ